MPQSRIHCLLKYDAMKANWRIGGIAPRIRNLGTKWWVVKFTPRPLYPWEKSPRYALDTRIGGLQNPSDSSGGYKKNSFPDPVMNQTLVLQPVA